jgi:hypothetical protein
MPITEFQDLGCLHLKLSHNVQFVKHVSKAPSISMMHFVSRKMNSLQILIQICEHDTKLTDNMLSQYIIVLRLPKLNMWQQTQKHKTKDMTVSED